MPFVAAFFVLAIFRAFLYKREDRPLLLMERLKAIHNTGSAKLLEIISS